MHMQYCIIHVSQADMCWIPHELSDLSEAILTNGRNSALYGYRKTLWKLNASASGESLVCFERNLGLK